MAMTVPIALIAAVGRNGAIGRDNRLPWRLSGDMQHFRALTMGKPVLMGRKTFQSIGRPLPGRLVVVVSADEHFVPPDGIDLARDMAAALVTARARGCSMGAPEIMVAGGAAIYAALLGQADRLYITEVDLAPPADAFFPAIDPAQWQPVETRPGQASAGDSAAFSHVTYVRRASPMGLPA